MIIVSGIPFSGVSLLLKILEYGGLEIVKSDSIEDYTFENDNQIIPLSVLDLKKIKEDYKIIFIERNIEKCFELMEKRMKKEPHRSAFELILKNLRKDLKKKEAYFINYEKLIDNPRGQLLRIQELIPNYEKVNKEINSKIITFKLQADIIW
jgi:hypothetical protein